MKKNVEKPKIVATKANCLDHDPVFSAMIFSFEQNLVKYAETIKSSLESISR